MAVVVEHRWFTRADDEMRGRESVVILRIAIMRRWLRFLMK